MRSAIWGAIMDIGGWLRSVGLERYEATFRANAIDADVLGDLTDRDLENLGVLLGHRRQLLRAIAGLASASGPGATPSSISPKLMSVVAPSQTPTEARASREREHGEDRHIALSRAPTTTISGELGKAEMAGGRFLPNRQPQPFLPSASDHDDSAIEAADSNETYGADECDLPSPRWRGHLRMVVAVLALAGSAAIGAFAYRGVVLPMLPPISKAENAPANNGANYGDARPSNSSQTSAGSFKKVVSREEQPIEMQVSPKVISTIPISPHQNAIRSDVLASVAAAPFAAAPSDTPGLRPIAWATSPIVDQPLSLAPGAQDHAAASPSPSPLPAGTGTAPERSFYAVQLASERSAADAHAVFRKLQAKFPNQLAGRLPIVRRADLDGEGVYYRAMVGPFASMKEADVLCSSLKAAGGSCGVERD